MLKSAHKNIKKYIKKKTKELKKVLKKKNKTLLLGVLIGLCVLTSVLGIFLLTKTKANDDIFFFDTNSSAILGSKNPNFNVSFGKREEPEKQWVRFEAKSSSRNPFEQEQESLFRKIVNIFKPKREFGIEMSLQGVTLGQVESLQLDGMQEKVMSVAEVLGESEVKTTTELIEKGSIIGQGDVEGPVAKKTVLNKGVADGVDIEYQILEGIGLKEEIVIRDLEEYTKECGEDLMECKLPLNEFVFDIKLDEGLELRSGWFTFKGKSTESYYFVDSDDNYVAHFLPSWAMDSVGNKTYDVILDVSEKGEGNYEAKVIVDINWLFSSERVYPVRIDPTIVHDTKTEFDAGIFDRTESDDGPKVQLEGTGVLVSCTGGTVTTDGVYTVHTFTSGGTLSCDGNIDVEYLVVAGGGGGGAGYAGGGGAGGLLTNVGGTALSLSQANYTITVGSGGTGSTEGNAKGGTGGNSSIASLVVASGGGGGGSVVNLAGASGGSGGGGAGYYLTAGSGGSGTSGQGNNGGNGYAYYTISDAGGGGGGAGSVGGNASASTGGTGGSGSSSSISGSSVTYSAGGNGGSTSGSNGASASANTGDGGGGGSSGTGLGGNGGSGIVIIRYETPGGPGYSSGKYTSSSLDLLGTSHINSISWEDVGVHTGGGETPYSSTSLVAQWNFNETSGTTAVSGGSCSTTCNGTLTNFATTTGQDVALRSGWTSDNRRWGAGAIMIDGSNDRVDVSDNTGLRLTSAGTISAWIRPLVLGTDPRVVDKSTDASATNGYSLSLTTGNKLQLRINAGTATESLANAITLGEWQHVVATFDNTGRKLYVNGQEVTDTNGSLTALPPNVSGGISIGNRSGATDRPFDGVIDSVKVYSRVLSASEILSNYQAGNIEFKYRTSTDGSTWGSWSGGTDTSVEPFNDNTYTYYSSNSDTLQASSTSNTIEGSYSLDIVSGETKADTNTVAYWKLDESGGTGAYIQDSSANTNHGTPTGGPTYNKVGKVGGARSFDGTDDYIYTTTSYINPQTLTISAWFKTSTASGKKIIGFENSQSGTGSTGYDRHLYIGTDGKLYFGVNDGSVKLVTSDNTANDGVWHHAVGVLESSGDISLYLDGVQQGTTLATSGAQNYTGYWRMGGYKLSSWTNGSDGYFTGLIDEVQISNIARTAEEIYESYRIGRDHRVSKTLTTGVDLSSDTKLPFWIASDTLGTNLELTYGNSKYVNYQADTNTVGFWHLDEDAIEEELPIFSATGGTVTTSGSYTIHTFTSGGTFEVTSGEGDVEYLVVAGGGGGGKQRAGGGGAGGFRTNVGGTGLSLSEAEYTITVGSGGAGSTSTTVNGGTGVDSSISTLVVASGGGGGGSSSSTAGASGGSGGGGAGGNFSSGSGGTGTSGQGNNGGNGSTGWNNHAGGGGGGAGAVGGNASGSTAGTAGSGSSSSISGSSVTYSVGGVGGVYTGSAGASASANTGGGGGGGGSTNNGGNGGSGIVIIRYVTPTPITVEVIKDTSTNANDGHSFGTTYTSTGKIGGARIFDGTNDYIEVAHHTSLNLTGSLSFGAWVNLNNVSTTADQAILGKGDSTFQVRRNGTSTNLRADVKGGTGGDVNVISNTALSYDTWYHVVVVYNGSNVLLYINGQLDNSASRTGTVATNSYGLQIGVNWSGTVYQRYFDGKIDEAFVISTNLTAEQVRQAYEVGKRSYLVNIMFKADLESANLITGSTDTSFTIDETAYGTTAAIENIDVGEKIIVKENYNGTEYVAQGDIATVNTSTGAVTVGSWDTGSTFPSGGFTVNADVFKWQREYVDIRYPLVDDKDSMTQITLRKLTETPSTFWVDDLRRSKYLTDSSGASFTMVSSVNYVQYRAVFTTWDTDVATNFYLSSVTVDYSSAGPTIDQLMRHGKWFDGSGVKQSYWWVNN